MTNKVLIIDYGVGNIRSVYQSITHLGFDCKVSNSKNEIINADKIIFPGVGAFGSGASGVERTNSPQGEG